jgi:hypothetical protein
MLLMFEFGKNVHLANFLNFLLGNDLTKFLFPYALLVLLEVVILDTIERMIGKKMQSHYIHGVLSNGKRQVLCKSQRNNIEM